NSRKRNLKMISCSTPQRASVSSRQMTHLLSKLRIFAHLLADRVPRSAITLRICSKEQKARDAQRRWKIFIGRCSTLRNFRGTIDAMKSSEFRNCSCCGPEHFSRRTLLKMAGVAGLTWLTPLGQLLALEAEKSKDPRAKSVIVLWLAGGPSQL